MKRAVLTREDVFELLESVKDPEVPVISIVELGIVRAVDVSDARVVVTITPTYSGCPAMREIESEIVAALESEGLDHVEVRTTYTPAWTTDWITTSGREKLEAYGIAPPGPASGELDLVPLRRRGQSVRCPYCKSLNTELKSLFGPTACKAIWFCHDCHQPFEEFKAI